MNRESFSEEKFAREDTTGHMYWCIKNKKLLYKKKGKECTNARVESLAKIYSVITAGPLNRKKKWCITFRAMRQFFTKLSFITLKDTKGIPLLWKLWGNQMSPLTWSSQGWFDAGGKPMIHIVRGSENLQQTASVYPATSLALELHWSCKKRHFQ